MFKKQKVYYFCEKTLTYKVKKGINHISLFWFLSIFVFILIVLNLITGNLFGEMLSNLIQSEKRNVLFAKNIIHLKKRIDTIQFRVNKLYSTDQDLRLMVNLPIMENDLRQAGVGGKIYIPENNIYNTVDFSDIEEIEKLVDKLSRQVFLQQYSFNEVNNKYKYDQKLFECIPALIPMNGTFDRHSFGYRRHPILGYVKMHDGVDIIAPTGTIIYSSGRGKIEKINYESGYGLVLEIDHGYGYKSFYAHLSSVCVNRGQDVVRGQKIAYCGNSGFSTGPHLHYEISLNGTKLNPVNFFIDDVGFSNSEQKSISNN
jgi:murein DD-endopeptidase MepM/ murein hydrolase activator NlpD